MTTLRILFASALAGLVAWWLMSRAPLSSHGWILLGLALLLIICAVIHHRHVLADLHHRQWLERAERLEAEPEREPSPSPVADTHLSAGLVETDGNVHVTRLNPKDDESIRRA